MKEWMNVPPLETIELGEYRFDVLWYGKLVVNPDEYDANYHEFTESREVVGTVNGIGFRLSKDLAHLTLFDRCCSFPRQNTRGSNVACETCGRDLLGSDPVEYSPRYPATLEKVLEQPERVTLWNSVSTLTATDPYDQILLENYTFHALDEFVEIMGEKEFPVVPDRYAATQFDFRFDGRLVHTNPSVRLDGDELVIPITHAHYYDGGVYSPLTVRFNHLTNEFSWEGYAQRWTDPTAPGDVKFTATVINGQAVWGVPTAPVIGVPVTLGTGRLADSDNPMVNGDAEQAVTTSRLMELFLLAVHRMVTEAVVNGTDLTQIPPFVKRDWVADITAYRDKVLASDDPLSGTDAQRYTDALARAAEEQALR